MCEMFRGVWNQSVWPFNLSIHMDIPLKWLTILECLDFDIETAKALLRLFTTKIMFAIFVKLLKVFFILVK